MFNGLVRDDRRKGRGIRRAESISKGRELWSCQ